MIPDGLAVKEWFVAAIQKFGTGSGDLVRATFATKIEGEAKCITGETLFPRLVQEGEFKIRIGS
jgi:hypothetical protein